MLTPILSLQEFGCEQLAARINNLRDAGWKITTHRLHSGKKWYAGYTLERP
jgi:hypothetical protein